MSYYYLNFVNYNGEPWLGTQMYTYKDLLTYKSPYIARFTPPDVRIRDGGWHFSYMGGIKQIQKKLASFSHQEYNNKNYNTEDKILKAILERRDFLPTKLRFKVMDDHLLPSYVVENKEKFSKMLINPSKLYSYRNLQMLNFYRIKNLLRTVKHKIYH